MSILHAIILGIIQGTGEFLPISSSGHLVVIPYIFNWKYQGLDFDVALHFGTFLAIVVFFWRDWVNIITRAISPDGDQQKTGDNHQSMSYPHNLFWILIISSIPAAIGGYFLDKLAEHTLRNELLISVMLAFFGLFLWFADRVTSGKDGIKNVNYGKGLIIGVAQVLAIVPGVSRSGITTSAGMFLNLSRQSATRFSFLLATPVLLGAFLFTLKDYSFASINLVFFVAVLSSAVTGFLAIKYLLRYLERHGFLPFVLYRIALAIIVAIIYFIR